MSLLLPLASSFLRGSQAAALSKLAQIESRIHSHKQVGRGPQPETENLTSDLVISPPSPGPPVSVTRRSPADGQENLRGRRFLKKGLSVAGHSSHDNIAPAASGAPPVLRLGARSRARAADIVSGVSLESDEEDMRKLLGDSLDSTDNLLAHRRSSMQKADKV